QLVPKLAVERFDRAVLPGAARLNEQRRDLELGQPLPERPGHELRSMVRSNRPRTVMRDEHLPQHLRHLDRFHATSDDTGPTLPGVFVHHGEDLSGAAILRAIHDEIIGPSMGRPGWPPSDTGTLGQPQTCPLRLLLRPRQALVAPAPLDTCLI